MFVIGRTKTWTGQNWLKEALRLKGKDKGVLVICCEEVWFPFVCCIGNVEDVQDKAKDLGLPLQGTCSLLIATVFENDRC